MPEQAARHHDILAKVSQAWSSAGAGANGVSIPASLPTQPPRHPESNSWPGWWRNPAGAVATRKGCSVRRSSGLQRPALLA